MRNRRVSWSTALEDSSGASEVLEAPVAEFEINVNEVDEDGAPLEAVDAQGEPTVDVTVPETEEALDDVEDAEEVVEKLEETSEVLESYAIAIESRINQNGGLTASEWELVQIGLKSRIKNIEALTPSKESFSYGRLSASNEALDALKEGLAKVWEAIKSAIMAVINRVRKWFIGALSDASRLAKRAKGIKAAAQKRGTSIKDGEKNIEMSGARGLVGKDGKPMDDKDYVRASAAYLAITDGLLLKAAGKVNDRISKSAEEVSDLVEEYAKKSDGDIANGINKFIGTDMNKAKSFLDDAVSFETKATQKTVNGVNCSVKSIDNLPGGEMFMVQAVVENGSGIKDVGSLRAYLAAEKVAFVKAEDNKKEVEDKQDFPILNRTTIDAICDNVETACDNIVKFKKDFEDRNKYSDGFIKKMDKIVASAGKEENVKNNPQVSAFIRALCEGKGGQVRRYNSEVAAVVQAIISKSKTLLAYAQRSASMYEK